mmetsp:Transcript_41499/g.163320  ORF Transcript_41499/g.163320 Transcript_41499/m.163320 type:complete len:281 (+) Transcript_41499:2246-3088(+)
MVPFGCRSLPSSLPQAKRRSSVFPVVHSRMAALFFAFPPSQDLLSQVQAETSKSSSHAPRCHRNDEREGPTTKAPRRTAANWTQKKRYALLTKSSVASAASLRPPPSPPSPPSPVVDVVSRSSPLFGWGFLPYVLDKGRIRSSRREGRAQNRHQVDEEVPRFSAESRADDYHWFPFPSSKYIHRHAADPRPNLQIWYRRNQTARHGLDISYHRARKGNKPLQPCAQNTTVLNPHSDRVRPKQNVPNQGERNPPPLHKTKNTQDAKPSPSPTHTSQTQPLF